MIIFSRTRARTVTWKIPFDSLQSADFVQHIQKRKFVRIIGGKRFFLKEKWNQKISILMKQQRIFKD